MQTTTTPILDRLQAEAEAHPNKEELLQACRDHLFDEFDSYDHQELVQAAVDGHLLAAPAEPADVVGWLRLRFEESDLEDLEADAEGPLTLADLLPALCDD